MTTAGYTGTDQLASKTEVSGTTTLASWTNVAYDLAQNRTAETLSYYASRLIQPAVPLPAKSDSQGDSQHAG